MPKAKVTKVTSSVSTSQKLKTISSRLRRGDIVEVSDRTGYDSSHVRRVLRGERGNPSGKIVQTAYTMVSKRKVTA
jgi:hypothetical protein